MQFSASQTDYQRYYQYDVVLKDKTVLVYLDGEKVFKRHYDSLVGAIKALDKMIKEKHHGTKD